MESKVADETELKQLDIVEARATEDLLINDVYDDRFKAGQTLKSCRIECS